jgi:hypothetical protein
MKKHLAYILSLFFCLIACDDNTGSLGSSVVPGHDAITIDTATYWATSKSIAVDSVLGRTDKVYLGRFTDPQTGSVLEADFIAQFNCEEGGLIFPDNIAGDTAVRVEIRLFFTSYFGDPTSPMKAEVYELENTLLEGEKYYSNLDPNRFYDATKAPLESKVYTITDYTLEDSELNDSEHYTNVNIPLPTEIGSRIIKQYREHKEHFANASSFIENVCKGYYIKAAQGDGTILYIDKATLNIHFRVAKSDSIYVTQFTGTQEVLQASRFNTKKLTPLVEDNACTYLKTPAGIFTEVELPIDEIVENHPSINSAKIIFNCYNDATDSEYKFGTPQMLLMIHKDEMYSFFDKNKLTDNISSYYTSYNSTFNRYEYNNISRLVTYCKSKRETSENWNKVVLIPVTTIVDSNNNIVNFRHDFSLNSVRLVGGADPIKVRVTASHFN